MKRAIIFLFCVSSVFTGCNLVPYDAAIYDTINATRKLRHVHSFSATGWTAKIHNNPLKPKGFFPDSHNAQSGYLFADVNNTLRMWRVESGKVSKEITGIGIDTSASLWNAWVIPTDSSVAAQVNPAATTPILLVENKQRQGIRAVVLGRRLGESSIEVMPLDMPRLINSTYTGSAIANLSDVVVLSVQAVTYSHGSSFFSLTTPDNAGAFLKIFSYIPNSAGRRGQEFFIGVNGYTMLNYITNEVVSFQRLASNNTFLLPTREGGKLIFHVTYGVDIQSSRSFISFPNGDYPAAPITTRVWNPFASSEVSEASFNSFISTVSFDGYMQNTRTGSVTRYNLQDGSSAATDRKELWYAGQYLTSSGNELKDLYTYASVEWHTAGNPSLNISVYSVK